MGLWLQSPSPLNEKSQGQGSNEGKKEFSYYYHHKFNNEYDALMILADNKCPPPPETWDKKKGRKRKGKERSLIERMKALKAPVCLFIKDFSVPFDNNKAERDVRNVKTKTKVFSCFRAEKGVQDYLDVMSYQYWQEV